MSGGGHSNNVPIATITGNDIDDDKLVASLEGRIGDVVDKSI